MVIEGNKRKRKERKKKKKKKKHFLAPQTMPKIDCSPNPKEPSSMPFTRLSIKSRTLTPAVHPAVY